MAVSQVAELGTREPKNLSQSISSHSKYCLFTTTKTFTPRQRDWQISLDASAGSFWSIVIGFVSHLSPPISPRATQSSWSYWEKLILTFFVSIRCTHRWNGARPPSRCKALKEFDSQSQSQHLASGLSIFKMCCHKRCIRWSLINFFLIVFSRCWKWW